MELFHFRLLSIEKCKFPSIAMAYRQSFAITTWLSPQLPSTRQRTNRQPCRVGLGPMENSLCNARLER